jgi:cation diffusion facilitator family transporter
MEQKDETIMPGVEQIAATLKLSILTAFSLALIKFGVGLATHSMAVMASALDSLMDSGVSFVNLIAAKEAAKPPDEEHAYGHGKIESLAALFQSTFIGLSGLYVVFESIKRLIFGSFVHLISMGIAVMLFSMLVTWLLVWRIRVVSQRNKSLILVTEGLHFTTDLLTNGGVIVALVLVWATDFIFWDLVVSIAVALYIFKVSFGILRRSIDELLDRSLSPVSKEEIEKIIRSYHPSIVGLHNFRSHRVGERIFLDFHIEIRGEDDFKRAHDMTESLIEEIRIHYPGADVTVHFDPEGAR